VRNRWAAVARFGGIGDDLMAASPLRALKRMGYMTEMITAEPYHVVFHHNPYIDKLSVHNTNRDLPKNDLPAWQRWFESRAREYDVFIHASHSCEGRHAVFQHMTMFWWSPECRRKICAGNYLETVHDIGNVPYDFGPLFFASEEEKANALTIKKRIGERIILWVLSGTRIDKVYPYATSAIPRIIKEIGAPVVVMSGPHPAERAMAETIRDSVAMTNGTRDGLHLAVPTESGTTCWPLRTSLAFALGADLVVTPDTGTAWAVAFEKMPKIVMLSHASVENITKHWKNTTTLHADSDRVPCWPCHRLHDDKSTCVANKEDNGAACISDISVETLVQTIAERWNSSNVIRLHAATA
jgi:ADP-heptose:LPS heptosyltransferase